MQTYLLISALSAIAVLLFFILEALWRLSKEYSKSTVAHTSLIKQVSDLQSYIKDSTDSGVSSFDGLVKAIGNTNQHLASACIRFRYIKDMKSLLNSIEQAYLSLDFKTTKMLLSHNIHVRYEMTKVEYNVSTDATPSLLSEIDVLLRTASLYGVSLPEHLYSVQSFKNYKRSLRLIRHKKLSD